MREARAQYETLMRRESARESARTARQAMEQQGGSSHGNDAAGSDGRRHHVTAYDARDEVIRYVVGTDSNEAVTMTPAELESAVQEDRALADAEAAVRDAAVEAWHSNMMMAAEATRIAADMDEIIEAAGFQEPIFCWNSVTSSGRSVAPLIGSLWPSSGVGRAFSQRRALS